MKGFASLFLLASLSGCAMTAYPTPAELAGNPNRYDDRRIVTCGQVVTGGGKCYLQARTKEIWLSSASALCAAPTPSITQAKISGLFSALTICTVAAVVVNSKQETLLVRKRGSDTFIQPGGKPDEGEEALAALARELGRRAALEDPPNHIRPRQPLRVSDGCHVASF